MTEEEIKEAEQGYSESKIQHICVTWFRMTFPKVANLLFAVPNGGWRGPKAGAMMVYEGQVKGVADLILLFPSQGKSALCVEMKVPRNRKRKTRGGIQSDEQKAWQTLVESYGSAYAVCRGLVDFINAVCTYIRTDPRRYVEEACSKYPLYR